MKRVKKKKSSERKYTITDRDVEKIKIKATKEATDKAALLLICAAKDVLDLSDEQCAEIMVRADRYAGYLDSHIVSIRNLQESIEKSTGLKFKGW